MTAGVRRIIPLTLGWADLPRSVSVEGASDHEMLREPVPGVLLLCDGGWLLLDTGYSTALITDPALRARFHGDPLVQPVLRGERGPGVRVVPGHIGHARAGPGMTRASPGSTLTPGNADPALASQPSGSMPFTPGTRTVRWPGLPPRMTLRSETSLLVSVSCRTWLWPFFESNSMVPARSRPMICPFCQKY